MSTDQSIQQKDTAGVFRFAQVGVSLDSSLEDNIELLQKRF
ncbi:hypothetical protein [Paenibacillus sp. USHLN196]